MSDFQNVTFSTSTVNKRYVALRYTQGLEGRCGEIGRRTRLKILIHPSENPGKPGVFLFSAQVFLCNCTDSSTFFTLSLDGAIHQYYVGLQRFNTPCEQLKNTL